MAHLVQPDGVFILFSCCPVFRSPAVKSTPELASVVSVIKVLKLNLRPLCLISLF